jgi:iron uptake system EfeUOB component EfeO/EfeM
VPSGDEATLAGIYAKVNTLIEDEAQYTAALRAGDTSKAKTLNAKGKLDQKAAHDASNAYGLTVCGS